MINSISHLNQVFKKKFIMKIFQKVMSKREFLKNWEVYKKLCQREKKLSYMSLIKQYVNQKWWTVRYFFNDEKKQDSKQNQRPLFSDYGVSGALVSKNK